MVDKPTFPLYRLPYVALKVPFHFLHPHEILRLSMVSKKSYSICKVFRRKVTNLRVRFDDLSHITSDCMYTICYVRRPSEILPENSKLESLKIRDTVFQVKMDECIYTLGFYCEDRLACLATLYEYLTDFYQVPLYEVELNGISMNVLDEVLARQKTLPSCHLSCSKSGDEEMRWFLDRIEDRVTEILCLNVKTSEDFRLNLRQPDKTDAICFGGRHTLTIDNFRELNSRVVFALKTNLTCEYLNSYLKKWQNGEGNPTLGCLKLGINLINVDTVLNGIEFVHRHHHNDLHFGYYSDTYPWMIHESHEIKRNDGTIASIIVKNGQNGEFKMCVWPDAHGKAYPELELADE